jgi:fido (protein-threonine AMPylation protein)
MSTSVIASGRQSVSSVFNVITASAGSVLSILEATTNASEVLVHKSRVLQQGALVQAQADIVHQRGDIIRQSALKTVTAQEEIHKRLFPGTKFDAPAAFAAALKEIEDALQP